MNLILTIVHELKHAHDLEVICKGDPKAYDNFDDTGAQGWAVNALYELASEGLEMDLPDLINDDFFGPYMSEFMDDINNDNNEPWKALQRQLFNDGMIMSGGVMTIKDYFRVTDVKEDREWVVNVDKDEPVVKETEEAEESTESLAGVVKAIDELKVEPTAQITTQPQTSTKTVVGTPKHSKMASPGNGRYDRDGYSSSFHCCFFTTRQTYCSSAKTRR